MYQVSRSHLICENTGELSPRQYSPLASQSDALPTDLFPPLSLCACWRKAGIVQGQTMFGRASAFNIILPQPARWPVKTDHVLQTHLVLVSDINATTTTTTTTTTKIFFLQQLGWIQNLKINTPVKIIKMSYLISAISLCLPDSRGI